MSIAQQKGLPVTQLPLEDEVLRMLKYFSELGLLMHHNRPTLRHLVVLDTLRCLVNPDAGHPPATQDARSVPRRVLVVGGGTSHGVALAAPRAVTGVVPRLKLAGEGGLEAGGRALSPFHVGGKRRWFAEPPHMQVSLIRVPEGVALPQVGDRLDVDVMK